MNQRPDLAPASDPFIFNGICLQRVSVPIPSFCQRNFGELMTQVQKADILRFFKTYVESIFKRRAVAE